MYQPASRCRSKTFVEVSRCYRVDICKWAPRGISPAAREGASGHPGAVPDGRASAPDRDQKVSETLLLPVLCGRIN